MWLRTCLTEAIPHCHEALWLGKELNKQTPQWVIHSIHTRWSAAIIEVPKGDSRKCLVIDYRALNKVTQKFMRPMPKVEDIFSKLNGAKYFSILDVCSGYHHVPLHEDSIPKTAFMSPFGKYEYLKVPFGQAQAPVYFQELMNKVLKDLSFAIAYLDDTGGSWLSCTVVKPDSHLTQISCQKIVV